MFKKELRKKLAMLIIVALMAQVTIIPSLTVFADDDNPTTSTEVTEVGELVSEVATETVAETIEEMIDSTDSESIVEDAVNEVVDEITEDLESMDKTEATEAIKAIEEDVQTAITDITTEISKRPGELERAKLMKKIQHLKRTLAKLRAKFLIRHKDDGNRLGKMRNGPAVFEVRWGVLNRDAKLCNVTREEIQNALDTNISPCRENSVSYMGTISVDNGILAVKKEHLFEKNDEVTVPEGTSISFDSVIAGHWDGLFIKFTPDQADDGAKLETNVTISLGDLNKTYALSEITHHKTDMGNGHEFLVKRMGKRLNKLSKANQDEILEHKIKIQDKISDMHNKLYRLKMLNKNTESLDDIEGIIEEAGDYTFDEDSSEEIQSEIDNVVRVMNDNISDAELKALVAKLRAKLTSTKDKSKLRKFKNKMIPFKDTDNNERFTEYVASIKKLGIINGYKDANGNELGEFGPSNNVTVSQMIKIALKTAGEESVDGTPALRSALNHWARGYVKKAEGLKLDIVDGYVDLNRFATRGEVVTLALQALGVTPDPVTTSTDFSDVSISHKHAAYILYAKNLGIVSGDAGKPTFRPDDPISRGEAAKIASQIIDIFNLSN